MLLGCLYFLINGNYNNNVMVIFYKKENNLIQNIIHKLELLCKDYSNYNINNVLNIVFNWI